MTMSPEMTPRTDHGYGSYEGAFGDIIGDARTIADVGAGDGTFAKEAAWRGKDVLRIDPTYAAQPPQGGNYLAADARDMSEVPDDSFEVAVSAYVLQHIEHGNGDAANVVKEMVRITERTDRVNGDKGYVAIFPVWRPERLREQLALGNFSDVAAVGFLGGRGAEDTDAHPVGRLERRNLPTLVIRKTAALTDERLGELADAIERSRGLTKKRTLGDMARKAIISTTGENRLSIHGRSI
jgi:SAM-dependent methyltransferase